MAAIAIIRVSGQACLDVYRALCPGKTIPKPRHAVLRKLFSPDREGQDPDILDSGALVLYFPAPATVTGEDVLELHVHGGTAIVKSVLSAIPQCSSGKADIRYAEPGEFTERAFYNNRLDLTQIEALGDALAAETEQQRRLAIRGSSSHLAERYESWRKQLLLARGELEAIIDFSEDQHFDQPPAQIYASISKQVRDLRGQVRASAETSSRGELLRSGINIALLGEPNVGKSSLLNRLVRRDAAIVSEQAGTTRDVVDVRVDIGGYACRFGDLAGLRNADDVNSIEEEGIKRARARASKADVVIVFLSIRQHPDRALTAEDVYLGAEVAKAIESLDPAQTVVCVLNKADLFSSAQTIELVRSNLRSHPLLARSRNPILPISCNSSVPTGDNGIETLTQHLTTLFGSMTEPVLPANTSGTMADSHWAESLGASERQRVLLTECLAHLDRFLLPVDASAESQANDVDVLLLAENLRAAASCLAKITGRGEAGDVEDVLGVVFANFCVGK